MSDDEQHDSGNGHGRSKVGEVVAAQPRWRKVLLGLSLIVALVAGGLTVVNAMTQDDATVVVRTESEPADGAPMAPPGTRGFVGGRPTGDGAPARTVAVEPAEPTVAERFAPRATAWAISLFVGLSLGIAFRTFLKTMAILAALAVVGLVVAGYFGTLDTSRLEDQTAGIARWVQDRAEGLKDRAMATAPSAALVGVGFVLGLRRK